MNSQLQQCIEMVKEWAGSEYLYFDTALQVKRSPHHPPFHIWGLSVSPAEALYVMDSEQQWHPVEAVAADELVIASIYQRLMWMGSKYAKAS